MITRMVICSSVAVLGISLCRDAISAETWAVRPRPSQEKRLAPELDLLRHCESHFMGVCRDGKAVFNIPSGQARKMQTMSVAMDSNVPHVHTKATRLLISYAHKGIRPSEATLKAAGLNKIEDYERGSFLLVEPQEAVSSKTVEALLGDDAVVHAAPDYIMSVSPVTRTAMAQPSIAGSTPNDPLFS